MLGFFGNIFIVCGLYGISSKVPKRGAFLFSIVGESCYIIRSVLARDWNLALICCVFLGMAIRGYINWRT